MQPVKLIIPGRYWDSQIYSGRLYLFHLDGCIRIINWDTLIDQYQIDDDLRIAMICAFQRSDYLYGEHWTTFFSDAEIMHVIHRKFDSLHERNLEVTEQELGNGALVRQLDNQFPFPHTDSRLYNRVFYVASQQGVWAAPCHKRLKYAIGQRPEKKWDAAVLAMAIYGNALAMATGAEGLFETPVGHTSWHYADDRNAPTWSIRQISEQDCVSCDWAFTSVFASSHSNSGYLAEFKTEEEESENVEASSTDEEMYEGEFFGRQRSRIRTFSRIRQAAEIFQHAGYAWAYRDKIYQASADGIRVQRFKPWLDDEGDVLQSLGEIRLQAWKGRIVSAGVAVFGNVVECDNAIVVLASDERIHTLPGEPVRWRVFPRSKHYENQLHVIYDDRLEVWSFNHDYFVDQTQKRLGVNPYLGMSHW